MDSSGRLGAPPPHPSADDDALPRLMVPAFAAITLPPLVLAVASVFIPVLRVIAAAWFVATFTLLVVGISRVRARFRGEWERSSLAVDDDQVRYTDWRGTEVVCPRSAVSTVTLLLITSKKRTSNLIVLRDTQDAPMMSIPAGVFSGESIDKFVSDLGVGPVSRRFVNSRAELDAVAPGLQLAGFFVQGSTPFDRFPALRRIVLGLLVGMVFLLVVFIILGSRG